MAVEARWAANEGSMAVRIAVEDVVALELRES
jgi:hypothetical protein